MELLAVIGGGALVWFAYTCARGWRHSGETLERLRSEADGKASSRDD